MSSTQPSVRREKINDEGGFKESRSNRRIALEMDYKKHPQFVAIRRLAEEYELLKVGP